MNVEASHWLYEAKFQKCLSPFSTYAISPIENWGYIFIHSKREWVLKEIKENYSSFLKGKKVVVKITKLFTNSKKINNKYVNIWYVDTIG